MTDIFLKLLNTGISAGWLILAVLVFRFVLRKAPKVFRCVLWGLVGLKLILPFSMESAWSLIPSTEVISHETLYASQPTIHSGIEMVDRMVNPVLSESVAPNPGDSVNPLQVWVAVVSPFIFGIIRPCIYIPFSLNEGELQCVLAHEKAHLQRGDHLWKLLGFLVLTIYWFQPLIVLGYILLCQDIELACDEKVGRVRMVWNC